MTGHDCRGKKLVLRLVFQHLINPRTTLEFYKEYKFLHVLFKSKLDRLDFNHFPKSNFTQIRCSRKENEKSRKIVTLFSHCFQFLASRCSWKKWVLEFFFSLYRSFLGFGFEMVIFAGCGLCSTGQMILFFNTHVTWHFDFVRNFM